MAVAADLRPYRCLDCGDRFDVTRPLEEFIAWAADHMPWREAVDGYPDPRAETRHTPDSATERGK